MITAIHAIIKRLAILHRYVKPEHCLKVTFVNIVVSFCVNYDRLIKLYSLINKITFEQHK